MGRGEKVTRGKARGERISDYQRVKADEKGCAEGFLAPLSIVEGSFNSLSQRYKRGDQTAS